MLELGAHGFGRGQGGTSREAGREETGVSCEEAVGHVSLLKCCVGGCSCVRLQLAESSDVACRPFRTRR